MKLYSNTGNIQSLKIAIAAELSGTDILFEQLDCGESIVSYTKKLPILEISPDVHICSGNAACRYVMSQSENTKECLGVEEWCEWESTKLQPILWPYLVSSIGNGKVDNGLVQPLKDLLNQLNDRLNLTDLLTSDVISAADVILWSSLFPALCDSSSLKDWTTEYRNISRWFNKLSSHPAFQKGFTLITGGKGISAFKAALLSFPAPPSIEKNTRKLKGLAYNEIKAAPEEPKEIKTTVEEEKAAVVQLTSDELGVARMNWISGRTTVAPPRNRVHPILPQVGEKNILITSALPYVNNVPHLGNIIGCVLSADVYSRFCRLRNYNVLYVCGTDEYGTATETKALEEGLTPLEICNKYNALHTEIYKWFNIDFDFFGRTTTPHQTKIAQDIFWKLYDGNFVLKDTVEQLHCQRCDRFLADRFVEGTCPLCNYEDARGDQCDKCGKLINATELKQPRCKVCNSTPEIKSSEHLFLDLPKLEPKLDQYLDQAFNTGIWTQNAKVITKSWIRDGLKPRCITRDLKWGTPVPLEGFTDKVFYVWFDAPIGYISITANYTDQWEKWWKNPTQVEMYNFMAKDNVPFHSVIFPCTLLGANDNYTIVNHLSATEYLNYEDGKFSKSRGVGVFGNDSKNTDIPADIWRFYLLYVRPESQDSVFSWEDFATKNNSELLNNLGNFVNRVLTFLANNYASIVPYIHISAEEDGVLGLINRELQGYVDSLEKIKLRDGLRNILNISRLGNQYMQSNKPWVCVKGNEYDRVRCATVIGIAANISCLISILLQPYMPEVSKTIQAQLNAPPECNVITGKFVCFLPAGHKIGKPSPLFTKIEPSLIADLKKKFAGSQDKVKAKAQDNGPIAVASDAEINRLTGEVTNQGNTVRQLKTEKADKSLIDAAVAKLLDLKKQLTTAQGGSPAPVDKKGKKGKKK